MEMTERNASFTGSTPFISRCSPLRIAVAVSSSLSSRRLMSGPRGRGTRTNEHRVRNERASVGGCNFLPPPSGPLAHPPCSSVLSASGFRAARQFRASSGPYKSRARSRTTHVHVCVIPGIDRPIDRADRSIECWIHVVFAVRCCCAASSFCLGLGSLAMPDVVESKPILLPPLNLPRFLSLSLSLSSASPDCSPGLTYMTAGDRCLLVRLLYEWNFVDFE